jgi:hypothetical protein
MGELVSYYGPLQREQRGWFQLRIPIQHFASYTWCERILTHMAELMILGSKVSRRSYQ